ncbi:non-homologous end-joining DNA ligase [Bordetella sp. H567]|uniref:non-homologous end-joining DNA ligase n=1 Tax=Bordetella sp. H567 TaxID=1697043 RepID=UPI00082C0AE9|nr:non-homologous end-joining DNA ligase [Bordetella sp. H567]
MSALPDFVKPPLATLVKEPPSGGYAYEVKFDGYRMLCRIDDAGARFYSREAKDWTPKLADLVARIRALELGTGTGWLDGEIVVMDEYGISSFQRLQNAMDKSVAKQVQFVAFDVPYWNGKDLRDYPFSERAKALQAVLAGVPENAAIVRSVVADVDTGDHAAELLAEACRRQLEGLIGKRKDAPYRAGRTDTWIKLKCRPRQEFVVGGWTNPGGSRTGFGALLVGLREGDKLRYSGRVGTGFSGGTIDMLMKRLAPLATDEMPFTERPVLSDRWGGNSKPTMHWVRPELVVEVAYTTITDGGILRQASFQGVREDKPARKVTGERAARV